MSLKLQFFPFCKPLRAIFLFNFILIGGVSGLFAQNTDAPKPVLFGAGEQTEKPAKVEVAAKKNAPRFRIRPRIVKKSASENQAVSVEKQTVESDGKQPNGLNTAKTEAPTAQTSPLPELKIIGLNAETPVNTPEKEAEIVAMEKKAFDLLNQKRIEKGLRALAWDAKAAAVARKHSTNMARYGFFSHRGLDGSTADERARADQIGKFQGIGENIAFNQGLENPVEFAVERFMISVKHRENLLLALWTSTGIGIATAEDGTFYITQIFLMR